VIIGESLGATMAVRLAGGHPELVDGLIVSGPVMRVQPRMIFEPSTVLQGIAALLLKPSGDLRLDYFMKKLISADPGVIEEVVSDPLIRKYLTVGELLKTHFFIAKTRSYAKTIKKDMPVLILQGSLDRCVVPYAVIELSSNIHSADQTVRWLYNHSHLMLETSYVRGGAISAIADWFDDHDPAHLQEIKQIEEDIRTLGGHVRN
jgi:alpha-beta hydrolase superfamily lysophospholipase